MARIRERFTRWYIKRGYTFEYKFKEIGKYELEMYPYFICPLWIKPLCIFFSPSIYVHDVTAKNFKDGLREGLDLKGESK